MSSAMMMDRGMMCSPMGSAGAMPGMNQPSGMPSMAPGMSMCMVPQCTMKIEKCTGGMKITCSCDDEVAAATLQNMCKMMAGGLCSLCCTMNGMVMCSCNMAMCKCECTMTKNGVCMTCTSGDKAVCDMIQACCDCLCACVKNGCQCCMMIGGMPVCCACCC
jgi:hypothetical protein